MAAYVFTFLPTLLVAKALIPHPEQIEMNNDIRESKRVLEDEHSYAQRSYGRVKAQQSTLDQLGLSEAEAIEYLLMLSREEDERRRIENLAATEFTSGAGLQSQIPVPSARQNDIGDNVSDEEEIFTFEEGDQEYRPARIPRPQSEGPSFSSRPPQFLSRSLSISNEKVQVSHSLTSERGFLGRSASMGLNPLNPETMSGVASPSSTPASSFDDTSAFPSMSPPSSGTPSRSAVLAGSWSRGSPSIVSSNHSAAGSSPTPSSRRGGIPSQSAMTIEEQEDAELRFVLELSLAEARSRGEV